MKSSIKEVLKEEGKRFLSEEDGIGVVEIILILVVLIGLVLIFKDKISEIIEKAFGTIRDNSDTIIDDWK